MKSLWIDQNQLEASNNLEPTYYLLGQGLNDFFEGNEFRLLGDMADISDGTRNAEFFPDGIPYIRLSNLNPPAINRDNLKFVSNISAIESKARIQKGDILVSKTGVIGKAVLVDEQFDGAVIGPDVVRLRLRKREDLPIVMDYLRSEAGQLSLKRHISASNIPKLSIKELRNLQIPVNPRIKMVSPHQLYVDEIERRQWMEKLKSKLQDSYEIDLARYEGEIPPCEFFVSTQEINPLRLDFGYYQIRHTRIFRDYLERANGEDWIRLRKVAEIIRNTISPTDWDGKWVNYISLASIETGSLVISNARKVLYNEVKSRARYIASTGNVLLGIVGPNIGEENQAIAVIDEKWDQSLVSSSFTVIDGYELDPYYLIWCLQHPFVRLQLRMLSRGQWQQMLSLDDLTTVKIPWLSKEKQAEISKIVAAYICAASGKSADGDDMNEFV